VIIGRLLIHVCAATVVAVVGATGMPITPASRFQAAAEFRQSRGPPSLLAGGEHLNESNGWVVETQHWHG